VRPTRRLGAVFCLLALYGCSADDRGLAPSQGVSTERPDNGDQGFDGCSTPGPGCECDEEGARIECDDVYSDVGGQVVCGSGDAVCENGRYGECIFNGNIHMLEPELAGMEALSLGAPSSCSNNPCDPECKTFNDNKNGLGNPASGVTEGPSGLTLPAQQGLTPAVCTGGTSGTCAHTMCNTGTKLTAGCDATKAGEPSCVTQVCAANPSCCSSGWTTACTDLVKSTCNVTCYADTAGLCFGCYNDTFDHDGDGFSGTNGDCLDCDANANPGAYDFAANGYDEDCDGTADNEVATCDEGLVLTATDPYHFAKSIELCRSTTTAATGKNRIWGVTSAALVQANGTTAPHSRGYAIEPSFGTNNLPKKGARLAAFSSGTARTPSQSGYVNPNGQFGSYDAQTSVAYPTGFPKNASGCPVSGSNAYDSSGIKMKIRVPTNAKSFSYNFSFMSSEYPEWVCTAYNDHFVALLTGSTATPANPAANSNNISFDSGSNPVSVNIAFFTVPGCPGTTCQTPVLSGTGFEGVCGTQTCSGSTNWLYTSAPVKGGEEITIHFAVWDQGDHKYDSTLLLDNWTWSGTTATIKTGVVPPPPPPVTYNEGTFVRDYDATGVCPAGQQIRWGHWSWQSTTPSDSSILFTIRTAATQAGLSSATELPLKFSNPPGPSALAGQQAKAKTGSPDTQNGSAVVDTTLVNADKPRANSFLRVTSTLKPSTDKLSAPTLSAWNLQFTCVDDQ
jgi:hypothetical protein